MKVHACGLGVALGACVSASLAAPTAFSVGMTAEIWDSGYNTIDAVGLLESGSISPGMSLAFDPLDSGFASAVNVSYSVVTSGLDRTVTISYAAQQGPLVFPALFETMSKLPDEGFYAVFFGVFFADAEWDGDSSTRTATAALFGEGEPIVTPSPYTSPSSFLAPGVHGFLDSTSPAEVGFFGAATIADTFEYVVEYRLVPSPGAAAVFGLGALAAGRRRR